MLYKDGIQPVMMSTQAGAENYTRFGSRAIQYCNQAKKEIAEKYNLEFIDIHYWTHLLNTYSSTSLKTILPDLCHYHEVGHNFEGGVLFRAISPMTIDVTKENNVIGFANNRIISALNYSDYTSDDEVTFDDTNNFGFKLIASHTNTTDRNMMTAYVFLQRPLKLVSYSKTANSQYLTVDGDNKINLTAGRQEIQDLDMGLHKIQVMSGTGNLSFYGIKFE